MFLPLFDRFTNKTPTKEAVIQSIANELKDILAEHVERSPVSTSKYDLLKWEYEVSKVIEQTEPRLIRPRIKINRIMANNTVLSITGILRFTGEDVDIEIVYR